MTNLLLNLLPWREEKRSREKKRLLQYVAVILLLSIGMVIFVKNAANQFIHIQNRRNHLLENEIVKLSKLTKEVNRLNENRTLLLNKIMTIYHIQSTTRDVLILLNDLFLKMPDGMYLNQIKRHQNKIELTGYTHSSGYLSQLLAQLSHHPSIDSLGIPNMKKVTIPNDDGQVFNLTLFLKGY